MILLTVACRACSAGWYGKETDRCPRCNGEVVVTGTMLVIPLRDAA